MVSNCDDHPTGCWSSAMMCVSRSCHFPYVLFCCIFVWRLMQFEWLIHSGDWIGAFAGFIVLEVCISRELILFNPVLYFGALGGFRILYHRRVCLCVCVVCVCLCVCVCVCVCVWCVFVCVVCVCVWCVCLCVCVCVVCVCLCVCGVCVCVCVCVCHKGRTGNLTHWGRGHLNCLNARSRGFQQF